jgi:hypothetical protein
MLFLLLGMIVTISIACILTFVELIWVCNFFY